MSACISSACPPRDSFLLRFSAAEDHRSRTDSRQKATVSVMYRDVAGPARGKAEHPEHYASGAGADHSEESDNGCLQLLPMGELVPLSQTLISPALACLLNLNRHPLPADRAPPLLPPRESGALCSDGAELQDMRQFQGQDEMREIEDGDRAKHSGEEACRMQILRSDSVEIFQEGRGDLAAHGASFKRSCLNAGMLDSYGMQLSDGDGLDDQGEGYGMSQLVDRENSSNSGDCGAGSGGGGTASSGARTLKRPRLVWTPQLHKRFVDAVSHLGIKNAVPKTIMQLMNVEGLTRENVASHLQKYRLYLRRVQQGSMFAANCGNSPTSSMLAPGLDHGHHHPLIGSPMSPVPTASSSDHLFSSSDIPPAIMASGSHHQLTRSLHLLPGPINHLVHQHLPSPLLQPVAQQQLNQAMGMAKSPPLFNAAQLDPRHHIASTTSPSPLKSPAWPSLYADPTDLHAAHHLENRSLPAGPPSPPRQALTLFPH